MKPIVLVAAVGTFVVAGAIAFAVIRKLDLKNPEIAFVSGGVAAVIVAAAMHQRRPGARNTPGVKVALGAVLAVTALLFGLALHRMYAPFAFFEVSVPISALGCFLFPFALFNTMWTALEKARNGGRPPSTD
jgi:hypothetical protein